MNLTRIKTKNIAMIGLMAALMCVCAWISVPMSVPFTMQTFAVFLSLFLFSDSRGLLSIVIYILLGAVGLPVFSSFRGGIGTLAGPTGGYIVGFILCAAVYLLIIKIFGKGNAVRIIGLAAGLVSCYLTGTLWFVYVTSTMTLSGIISALSICVLPFIIPDILKLMLAFFVSKRLEKAIKK